MNHQTFTVTGIAAAQMQVRAQAIYYRKATLSDGATDETIIVRSAPGGDNLILEPGQGCAVDGDATDWTITNASGVGTIQGELIFGNKGFTDNRLKVNGTVEVVDGGKARTVANMAFSGYVTTVGTPGNFPHCQIYNPAASGKRVVIESAALSCQVANTLNVRGANAALTALYVAGASKHIGAAASGAELRTQTSAVFIGINTLQTIDLAAGIPFRMDLREPIVLEPGMGLNFIGSVATAAISINVEWYEELVGAA